MGHRGEDFGFQYRRFGFGAFRDEYLEAAADDEAIRLRRFIRDGEDAPVSAESPTPHPVLDGTALFWALGLLPLDEGRRYRFPTWNPTADGLELRESAVFEVKGRRSFDLAGTRVEGHVIVAHAGSGQVEMLVMPPTHPTSWSSPLSAKTDLGR